MGSAGQTIRVGYVNVRGLSLAKWDVCCALLETCFDFLVIAETWFVERRIDGKDKRIICKSLQMEKGDCSRCKGGLYLLGNARARSLIAGTLNTTTDTITFCIGTTTISAVYLPPSMSADDVDRILESISFSAVIVGDINTRFDSVERKPGQHAGPKDRQRVFASLQQSHEFELLEPQRERPVGLPRSVKLLSYLTVDHCLAFKGLPDPQLWCLSTRSLHLETDHDYCLLLHLRAGGGSPKPMMGVISRFRIGRLNDETTRESFRRDVETEIGVTTSQLCKCKDVDRMDALLVGVCQRALRRAVGEASKITLRRRTRKRGEEYQELRERQDPEAAVRLFKLAKASSQENDDILPTAMAERRNVTALDEVRTAFANRFRQGDSKARWDTFEPRQRFGWSVDMVEEEIRQQDASKSPGCDGIHIQALKSLLNHRFISLLHDLFRRCVLSGKTPLRWNRTEIHLLTKDNKRRRDKDNLRPITLICMFRKVFERLLLKEFDEHGWAKLNPAQAGFRTHYSTYVNAAVVHYALASASVHCATFLDFRAAFDVVNHGLLQTKLWELRCPPNVLSLVQSLMFREMYSRVLVNGEVSEWFIRRRGVLQGSPLSPLLFNLFVDSLLWHINVDNRRIPRMLFYADDGVLLADSAAEMQQLVDVVTKWASANGIQLNVAKCGYVARDGSFELTANGDAIPYTMEYPYLGFPIGPNGIKFEVLLQRRFARAMGLVDYLRRYSDDWGPAHRLRIYRRYLAPMWEYGAPLVSAWAAEKRTWRSIAPNAEAFEQATQHHRDILGWVAGCTPVLGAVAANVMGVAPLAERFQHLHLSFKLQLHDNGGEAPLCGILDTTMIHLRPCGFTTSLRAGPAWSKFLQNRDADLPLRTALQVWRRRLLREAVLQGANAFNLTRVIHWRCRSGKGPYLADVTLKCSIRYQQRLLLYRLGQFRIRHKCRCEENFVRGHERCPKLNIRNRLSRVEKGMRRAEGEILAGVAGKFTDVDWLLNTKQLARANSILEATETELNTAHKDANTSSDGA